MFVVYKMTALKNILNDNTQKISRKIENNDDTMSNIHTLAGWHDYP